MQALPILEMDYTLYFNLSMGSISVGYISLAGSVDFDLPGFPIRMSKAGNNI
jgi:hypothetical protein